MTDTTVIQLYTYTASIEIKQLTIYPSRVCLGVNKKRLWNRVHHLRVFIDHNNTICCQFELS